MKQGLTLFPDQRLNQDSCEKLTRTAGVQVKEHKLSLRYVEKPSIVSKSSLTSMRKANMISEQNKTWMK